MADSYLRGRAGGSGVAGAATDAAGLTSWKPSVVVATTANGALATAFAAGQSIDGVVLVAGWRILIKNQTAGAENGIYVVQATGAPVRAADANTGPELVSATVPVDRGTANADKAFTCTNDAIVLGTTAIVWVAFSASVAVANISDAGSFGRSLLQTVTSAIATALLDLATTTVKGLMSATDKVKLGYLGDLIDSASPAGVATWTSAAWTAEAYEEIIITFRGKLPGGGYLGLRINADNGANYIDCGENVNSAITPDPAALGVNTFARGPIDPIGNLKTTNTWHFFPRVDGLMRTGWSAGSSMSPGAITQSNKRFTTFAWNNTVTAATFITLCGSYGGATLTGKVTVRGIPA